MDRLVSDLRRKAERSLPIVSLCAVDEAAYSEISDLIYSARRSARTTVAIHLRLSIQFHAGSRHRMSYKNARFPRRKYSSDGQRHCMKREERLQTTIRTHGSRCCSTPRYYTLTFRRASSHKHRRGAAWWSHVAKVDAACIAQMHQPGKWPAVRCDK